MDKEKLELMLEYIRLLESEGYDDMEIDYILQQEEYQGEN